MGFILTDMLVCRSKGDAALIYLKKKKDKLFLPMYHHLIFLVAHSQDLSHVRHTLVSHLCIS